MDWYKPYDDKPVDLDDPKTYTGKFWKKFKNTRDMYDYAWDRIGRSIVYMDFLRYEKREEDMWADQRIRVHQFAFLFAWEHQNRLEDTEENRMWWRKFIYKFDDEVENQC